MILRYVSVCIAAMSASGPLQADVATTTENATGYIVDGEHYDRESEFLNPVAEEDRELEKRVRHSSNSNAMLTYGKENRMARLWQGTVLAADRRESADRTGKSSSSTVEKIFMPFVRLEQFQSCRRCHAFILEISREGKVRYFGKAPLAMVGEQWREITKEEVGSIINLFQDASFFSLEDRYPSGWEDDRVVDLTYSDGQRSRSVRFGTGAPPALYAITSAIERAVNVNEWICRDQSAQKAIC